MDESLTRAPLAAVLDRIARTILSTPVLSPDLGGIRLVPHQLEAAGRILHLFERHGGALLGDVTGMGKTYVALAVARLLGRTVVVAPSALRTMWNDALERTGLVARVLSYEELSRGTLGRRLERPRLVILDEAHHLRNPATRRYRAAADLTWGANVLLLSATPVHNRLGDLQSMLALFLGERAFALGQGECLAYVVRRHQPGTGSGWRGDALVALPALDPPRWLPLPPDESLLDALLALPPAVPALDGGIAHGLLTLGLVRAWSSSVAALRGMLRRRLQRGTALLSSLEEGRHPTRAELSAWTIVDDALQLALPGLSGAPGAMDTAALRDAVSLHLEHVRGIVQRLTADPTDGLRAQHLADVLDSSGIDPVVAFTQYADTATALYGALGRHGGVVLVSGRGARIASGRIAVDEVVRRMDAIDGTPDDPRLPLRLLVTTDVLSEGLSLRRARTLVHLDLPWTIARLEQRVGRLRRLGSPHRRIVVFTLGPPVTSRRLTSVVRALQRKARLTSVLGGIEPDGPIAGIHLGRLSRQVVTRGDSHAAEDMRIVLSAWMGSTDRGSGTSAVVEFEGDPLAPPWLALALVRLGGAPALVAVGERFVTDRSSEVMPIVRQVDSCRAVARLAQDDEALPTLARARLVAWLREREGGQLVSAATDAPSAAHASVLRYLDGMMAGAPRSALPSVMAIVSRCRSAVLASRGAGAERAMERWLAERAAMSSDTTDVASFSARLEERLPDYASTGPGGSIEALVVLKRAGLDLRDPVGAGQVAPDAASWAGVATFQHDVLRHGLHQLP